MVDNKRHTRQVTIEVEFESGTEYSEEWIDSAIDHYLWRHVYDHALIIGQSGFYRMRAPK